MRPARPVVLTAALAVLVGAGLILSRRAGSSSDPVSPQVAPQVPEITTESAPPTSLAPRLSRNPFEYGGSADEEAPLRVGSPKPAFSLPSPSAAVALPAVRLVGFLWKGGGLKAVVSLTGEVAVLAVGESANGYTLLAADEETGARLRGPDGNEITLAAPDSSGS